MASVSGELGGSTTGGVDAVDVPIAVAVGHGEDLIAQVVGRNVAGPVGDGGRLAAIGADQEDTAIAGVFPHIATIVGNTAVQQENGIGAKEFPCFKHHGANGLGVVHISMQVEAPPAITDTGRVKDQHFAGGRPVGVGIFGIGADWRRIFAIWPHQHHIVNGATVTIGRQIVLRAKVRLAAVAYNRPAFASCWRVEDQIIAVTGGIPAGIGNPSPQFT